MMDLNHHKNFSEIDKQDMLTEINNLPEQLSNAWHLGETYDLPNYDNITQVLITGMGGSAIGADLLTSYISPMCSVPVFVHRNYGLPAWATGPRTLVIASSHSGNTEETLSAYGQSLEQECRTIAISTGGELSRIASSNNAPVWTFEHTGQPRAAVGYSFGLLLAVLKRLGLIPDPTAELLSTIELLQREREKLIADVPVHKNLAKRLAGQILGRWVSVFASDALAPVARRWKGQISEIAKAWSQFEFLPEADHNTLAGVENPEPIISNTFALFLRSSSDHPRNRTRVEITRRIFMLHGMGTDIFDAVGETTLSNQWTCLQMGDYVSYYLAMAYGTDPTPVEAIQGLKKEMAVKRI